MLYQFVKPLARWVLGLNFKRIYLSGKENIPEKGPVIFAANHPTAFIEPCVLASFQNRPLHFLVRGDFFSKKIFSYLLRVLHMIPIYRMKDGGFAKIRNNFSSFDRCYEALAEGKCLMVLSEGFCIHEKKLRPIRKGTARVAFGTVSKFDTKDLQIIPVGVNYTHSDRYRSDLMIDFGTPIRIADYMAAYREDEPEAIRRLTADIESSLLKSVIHLNDGKDEPLAERIFDQYRLEEIPVFEDALHFSQKRLSAEKQIADVVNTLGKEDRVEVEQALDEIEKEQGRLGKWTGKLPKARWVIILVLILLFPLALIGVLFLAIPYLLMEWIGGGKKMSIEFSHSVKVATALGALLLINLGLLVLCIHFGSWLLLTFFILGPISIWITLRYIDGMALLLNSKSGVLQKEIDLLNQRRKNLLRLFE